MNLGYPFVSYFTCTKRELGIIGGGLLQSLCHSHYPVNSVRALNGNQTGKITNQPHPFLIYSVATCLENLEMPGNLEVVRGKKSCQGKLPIAYFKPGTTSVSTL